MCDLLEKGDKQRQQPCSRSLQLGSPPLLCFNLCEGLIALSDVTIRPRGQNPQKLTT